jgi:hypothetical protein
MTGSPASQSFERRLVQVEGASVSAQPPVSTPGGMLREPDFLKLWAGLTISLLGAHVSGLALPLTAVLVLGAGATETGVLGAARWAPYLLLGLLAGVWLDRAR